jgi:site-specific recombinase XerD
VTIAEALEGWYLYLRSRNASHHTLARYGRVWRRFSAYLAERNVLNVEEMKAEHARLFILQRMGQVKPISAHYEVTPLKAFTSWLEEMELLDRDPFRKVRKPKVEQNELAVLSAGDVRKLLACFDKKRPDEYRDYVIVSLILATGLRRAEATSALVENFDREGRSLLVMGKGRKQRRVPLPADVVSLIWLYIKRTRAHYAKSPYLFVTHRGGPLEPSVLTHRFATYVKRAGIQQRATLHGLRHWAATTMLGQAMPLELVSRTLGHADATITSRVYAHVAFRDVQRAYDQANPLRLVS